MGPSDFWVSPPLPRLLLRPKAFARDEPPRPTARHVEGGWEIELATNAHTRRWVIDDSTGFVRQSSTPWGDNPGMYHGLECWQFFPVLLPNGVAIPKLSVQVHYEGGKQRHVVLTMIDQVELLDSLSPETFIVAAPAGTNIVDYRGMSPNDRSGGTRAPSGVVATAVPDVVAHCDHRAARPLVVSILKVGDACPDLSSLTWVDATGNAVQPDFGRKIVVIDFWGVGCGPCVGQLPEINAAAKHFADSKIQILGLHYSGTERSVVAEFAKKQGLVYLIAIDKPDPAGKSYGATFAAFGVNPIPTCFVIDENGKVAYFGDFGRAIEVANRLAAGK
jgi:peroxiredoxin